MRWTVDLSSAFWFAAHQKSPPFFLFSLRPGKAAEMYLKQSLSWSTALTNCFIIPSLMCKGSMRMLFLSTSGSLITFLPPQFRLLHSSQETVHQCFCFALLSQGYLVYPLCWPSRKLTIFKSIQIFQLWFSYWRLSRTTFTLLWFSFSSTEWPIRIEPYAFPYYAGGHTQAPLRTVNEQLPITWHMSNSI